MKIAYIHSTPVPDKTPSTIQIVQMADALAQAGSQVHLYSLPGKVDIKDIIGRDFHPNLTLIPIEKTLSNSVPLRSSLLFNLRVLIHLYKFKPDIIYLRRPSLAKTLLKFKIKSAKYIFETHEVFHQTSHEAGKSKTITDKNKNLEDYVYTKINGIVSITEGLKDDIFNTFPNCCKNIITSPDGVDLTLVNQVKDSYSDNNKVPHLLYIGSLHKWKGVQTLLEAMPYTSSGHLHIAGGKQSEIETLKLVAQRLGISSRVTFIGYIAPKNRFQIIAKSDICLLPLSSMSIASKYTSPLKLFEYMAMGKPIISADLPSIREVITHKQNGFLVEPESPVKLGDAINQLISDKALQKSLGENALKDSESYTWINRANTLQKWFKSI